MDFNNGSLERLYPELSTAPEYYRGIFFVHIEPKGNYLLHLFATVGRRPVKIVFVDDKLSQVESVCDALTQLDLPHECYFYSATEPKGRTFDPLIANIQLYCFYKSNGMAFVSDEEAAQIAKRNPDKDADSYLRAAMKLAK